MNKKIFILTESQATDLKKVLQENTLKLYVVVASDPEYVLLKFLDYLKSQGSIGHTCEIVIDREGANKRFEWDGDGSDSIAQIYYKKINDSKIMYEISCIDSGESLKEMLEAIQRIGNDGHSFNIIGDPDDKKGLENRTFYWDGDGGDHISKIYQSDLKELKS
jgi:hypothetical protein